MLYSPTVLCSKPFSLFRCKKTMPNSLNSRRVLKMIHLDQVDLHKTCPDVPYDFRVSGCDQESPEHSRVDWERGILQSCSLLQDHRILLHRSISELFQLLHSKFFVTPQFLGNTLHDLAENALFLICNSLLGQLFSL